MSLLKFNNEQDGMPCVNNAKLVTFASPHASCLTHKYAAGLGSFFIFCSSLRNVCARPCMTLSISVLTHKHPDCKSSATYFRNVCLIDTHMV